MARPLLHSVFAMSASKLFQSVRVGDITLAHRVVLAPLTRFRHTDLTHVALPNVKEYYAQRGSTPGTLLISEATFIAPQAGGYKNAPGIWSDEQIKGWKEVCGSPIYCRLSKSTLTNGQYRSRIAFMRRDLSSIFSCGHSDALQ